MEARQIWPGLCQMLQHSEYNHGLTCQASRDKVSRRNLDSRRAFCSMMARSALPSRFSSESACESCNIGPYILSLQLLQRSPGKGHSWAQSLHHAERPPEAKSVAFGSKGLFQRHLAAFLNLRSRSEDFTSASTIPDRFLAAEVRILNPELWLIRSFESSVFSSRGHTCRMGSCSVRANARMCSVSCINLDLVKGLGVTDLRLSVPGASACSIQFFGQSVGGRSCISDRYTLRSPVCRYLFSVVSGFPNGCIF